MSDEKRPVLPSAAAALAMTVGFMVLVGWAAGLDAVKSVIPGAVQMKPNSALSLLMAGAALALDTSRWRVPTAGLRALLALSVGTIGAATLLQYATGQDLGIDQAMFLDTANAFNANPGRMSPFTAAAFVLLSLALALRGKTGWLASVSNACAALVGLVGGLTLVGYVWNATELVTDRWVPPVAIHAGAVLLALGAGLLAAPKRTRGNVTEVQMDRRLLIAFSGKVAVLLAMASFTYRSNVEFLDAARMVTHTQKVRVELARLAGCVNRIESAQRLYLLMAEPESRQAYAFVSGECRTPSDKLRALVVDNPAQVSRALELSLLVARREVLLSEVVVVLETAGRDAARESLLRTEGPPVMEAIRSLVEEMDVEEQRLLEAHQAQQSRQRAAMLASLLATLVVLIGVLAKMLRAVRRQLHESASLRWLAEDAARAKAAFLANMSHEIRTPLTGVLGLVDLLVAEPLDARQKGYVKQLRSSGLHLLTVVNDILEFSRIEASAVRIEQVDFSIADVLERVRSSLHTSAVERGLQLDFEVADDLAAPVAGDPTRLTQVLLNLVSNAIKFTEVGGVVVTVSSTRSPSGDVVARFEVRDTGIGIPAETLRKLFAPFVQADSSTARRFGGSGLGLAISKRLVEAMGGAIEVRSAPGRGSCFHFELTYKVAMPDTDPPATMAQPVLAPRPCRLLVAEDVPVNRNILRAFLERQGHDLTFAENGVQAVELAQAGGWDIILMDVQMPLMDGMEATRRIRMMSGPAGKVPIIGLTANVLASERQRYLATGMVDCLDKPIDWPRLQAALAQHAPPVASVSSLLLKLPGEDSVKEHVLANLRAAFGDDEARQLLQDGLQAYRGYCDAIERDIATPSAVAVHAHKIKGSAGTLGLAALTSAAAEIEAAALVGDVRANCAEVLRALVASAERAIFASA